MWIDAARNLQLDATEESSCTCYQDLPVKPFDEVKINFPWECGEKRTGSSGESGKCIWRSQGKYPQSCAEACTGRSN